MMVSEGDDSDKDSDGVDPVVTMMMLLLVAVVVTFMLS